MSEIESSPVQELIGKKLSFQVVSPKGEPGSGSAQVELGVCLGAGRLGRVFEGSVIRRDSAADHVPETVAVKIYQPGAEDQGRGAFSLMRKTMGTAREMDVRIAMPKVYGESDQEGAYAIVMQEIPEVLNKDLLAFKREFPGLIPPILAVLDVEETYLLTCLVLDRAGFSQTDRKAGDWRFGYLNDIQRYTILDWDLQTYSPEARDRSPEVRDLKSAGALSLMLTSSSDFIAQAIKLDSELYWSLGSFRDRIILPKITDKNREMIKLFLKDIEFNLPPEIVTWEKTLAFLSRESGEADQSFSFETTLAELERFRCQVEKDSEYLNTVNLHELQEDLNGINRFIRLYWKHWSLREETGKAKRELAGRSLKEEHHQIPPSIMNKFDQDGIAGVYYYQALLEAAIRREGREILKKTSDPLPEPQKLYDQARRDVLDKYGWTGDDLEAEVQVRKTSGERSEGFLALSDELLKDLLDDLKPPKQEG